MAQGGDVAAAAAAKTASPTSNNDGDFKENLSKMIVKVKHQNILI